MESKCACEATQATILACSGGSNCGQIANAVAVQLTREGIGSMYCLAGVAAHLGNMVASASSAERLMVIDGCAVACGKKVADHLGLRITDYIDVTAEGIAKNHDFDLNPEEIERVVARGRMMLWNPPVQA
jgi:uncharacterized metal-binding protein